MTAVVFCFTAEATHHVAHVARNFSPRCAHDEQLMGLGASALRVDPVASGADDSLPQNPYVVGGELS